MKILLAGPGTGKTSKIEPLIKTKGGSNVLILSFTNSTINSLLEKLSNVGITEKNCMTLHKFAIKYNHDKSRHVLQSGGLEEKELKQISKILDMDFNNLCDFLSCTTFDQMIDRFVSYAKTNDTYLKEKLSNYTTIIIDEYQDFNPHEQALIDLLLEIINDSYIMGDDDQCIYDFKDASNDKLILLHNNNDKVDHEHICYRCPDKVVHHASILIRNNKKRIDKKWEKSSKDGDLFYKQLTSFSSIADYIAQEILKITNKNESILILSPVQFAIKEILTKLDDLNIKYTNHFTQTISDSLIIKSWKIKLLFGGFKYTNLVFLGYKYSQSRKNLYALLKKHVEKGQNFDELFKILVNRLPEELKISYSNIDDLLKLEDFSELSMLYSKTKGITDHERLEDLFRHVEEVPDEKVNIMSIHKSKGLDADHVFMVGLIEGIIPNKKKGTDSIESQRRLFYVGMTRTKKNLHLLSNVKVDGKYARTVNFDDFRADRQTRITKLWNGKSSTFISELKLN